MFGHEGWRVCVCVYEDLGLLAVGHASGKVRERGLGHEGWSGCGVGP